MTYEERQKEIERIRSENHAILATPLLSEGTISPMQVGMMSDKQRLKWKEQCSKKIDLEYQIKMLSKTDEQLELERSEREDKERAGKITSLNSRIYWLETVGRSAATGKIRPKYQREIDKCNEELRQLL